MIDLQGRVEAFAKLGKKLENYLDQAAKNSHLHSDEFEKLSVTIEKAHQSNNWFTIESQLLALKGIRQLLDEDKLSTWAASYSFPNHLKPRTVAVIMAGNIPAVGFHDFLSVLTAGHRFLGKLSTDDRYLLPALADLLIEVEPRFEAMIRFSDRQIRDFDAVIATGSDNTARYFDYYFGRYPHIIRHNRNSLGIIGGNEQQDDLVRLADDIFSYFGLGCRSVSHLLLPRGYHPEMLFEGFEHYRHLRDHHKYFNNYEYHKAVCIINKLEHHDNGFVLLMPDNRLSSPVGVVHYSFYDTTDELAGLVEINRDRIQCLVSQGGWFEGSLDFGQAQFPQVWDYADNVDTMEFLLGLSHS